MASIANTNPNKKKEIVSQVPSFIHVYSDGTIERLKDMPRVPPSPEDPETGVSSKDIVFSNDPHLSARLYLPKLTTQSSSSIHIPVLVYFHGGAFCCESASASHHHQYCNIVASQGNVVIVSIEHRKAPEHYLPATYEDCWAGLCWVASHATQNPPTNSDPWIINHADFNKLFIGGDSSGGNIAHNIAMRAGVEALPGGVKVYGAYLNHPLFWASKTLSGPVNVGGYGEEFVSILWGFVYPAAPGGLDNPMLNPMAAGAPSLATLGCSKMFVAVAGKDELVRDVIVLYYEAVKGSGWKGEVELFEEDEEEHVYYMFHPETEQAKRFFKKLADFLRH